MKSGEWDIRKLEGKMFQEINIVRKGKDQICHCIIGQEWGITKR